MNKRETMTQNNNFMPLYGFAPRKMQQIHVVFVKN